MVSTTDGPVEFEVSIGMKSWTIILCSCFSCDFLSFPLYFSFSFVLS